MNKQFLSHLRDFYNADVTRRDSKALPAWKMRVRSHLLHTLQKHHAQTLLEVGAGTGRDSLFFQENGLTVTATDLSPNMVDCCRQKGLNAYVMDFYHLNFLPASFDALYAMSCLLHVPKVELPAILQILHKLLKPKGLLYVGLYGGPDHEGTYENDPFPIKRFFASYSDEQIKQQFFPLFSLIHFERVYTEENRTDYYYQSMIWQQD